MSTPTPSIPHVHLVQFDMAWEDHEKNRGIVSDMLDSAPINPGDLIVLPEMFDTGFSFRTDRTNDNKGETLSFLLELAEDHQAIIQAGRTLTPCAASTGCTAKNVMSVVAPGQKLLAQYTKIHPFQREADRFSPGSDIITYNWPASNLSICPAICYDLRFPELFRAGLSLGAQAFAIGACWPNVRHAHWRALSIARAIENQAFVFAVNRTGTDPMLTYAGGSMVIGPKGEILGELGNEQAVLSIAVNPADVTTWREAFPAWKDARSTWQPAKLASNSRMPPVP